MANHVNTKKVLKNPEATGRKGHKFLWGNPLLSIREALGEKAKNISHPDTMPCSPTTQALLFHHHSCSRAVHINTMPVIDLFLVSTRHSFRTLSKVKAQHWCTTWLYWPPLSRDKDARKPRECLKCLAPPWNFKSVGFQARGHPHSHLQLDLCNP